MPTGKKSRSTTGARTKTGRKSARSQKSPAPIQREATMFDPPACDNLYYIAHNASDALEIRGFRSSLASAKKKRGKKGKKKWFVNVGSFTMWSSFPAFAFVEWDNIFLTYCDELSDGKNLVVISHHCYYSDMTSRCHRCENMLRPKRYCCNLCAELFDNHHIRDVVTLDLLYYLVPSKGRSIIYYWQWMLGEEIAYKTVRAVR